MMWEIAIGLLLMFSCVGVLLWIIESTQARWRRDAKAKFEKEYRHEPR